MSEQQPFHTDPAPARKRFSWRPRRRLIWGAASGVALAGILALGYTAFSLGISNLDERLARLESQGSTAATVETVAALQSDVTTLKTGLQDTRKKLGEIQQARTAPFVLTGVEKRGAESWAAIAPRGYSSLSQVALVGEGETVAGWTLVSAGYGEATFRVNGRLSVLRAE